MSGGSEIGFPAIESADADGLVMLGGQLSAAWLMCAYTRGIFPWPLDDKPHTPPAWWSPDPRAVIEWDEFHISRRLERTLKSQKFDVTFDHAFADVIYACAEPRADGDGVWLTSALQDAFIDLHGLGCAHSVEAWSNGRLAGGVYGLAIGGYFSAESMFFRKRDASKVALSHLVRRLRERQFTLFDVQVLTEHTRRMGATEIARSDFLKRLESAIATSVSF